MKTIFSIGVIAEKMIYYLHQNISAKVYIFFILCNLNKICAISLIVYLFIKF